MENRNGFENVGSSPITTTRSPPNRSFGEKMVFRFDYWIASAMWFESIIPDI